MGKFCVGGCSQGMPMEEQDMGWWRFHYEIASRGIDWMEFEDEQRKFPKSLMSGNAEFVKMIPVKPMVVEVFL